MNQQKSFNSPNWKGMIVNIVLSVGSLFFFLFIGSFVLMHIHYFERFYSLLVYLCFGMSSLVISVLSKKMQGNLIMNAFLVSLVITLLFLIVTLIFSPYQFSVARLFPCFVMVILSVVTSYFLGRSHAKKYKHKKFTYKK